MEIPNRGGKALVRALDPSSDADLRADGLLLRRGYTLVWLGWQFDVRAEPFRVRLHAPVAGGITGRVRSDFIVAEKTATHPLAHVISGVIGGTGYPVKNMGDKMSVLTEREGVTARRRVISSRRWRFVNPTTIELDGGFRPGKIYELLYTATDPAVAGTGFAAVRDFATYCLRDAASVAPAKAAYAFGISQSGRFLRHFLYEGFNADEDGRRVFDAMLIHVAGAGRGSFNHRFAQPSRDAQPLSPVFHPNDLFPFTDVPTTDPVTGATAGLLDRAMLENVVPKIFHTSTSYEYWSRGASLTHTTPDAQTDVAPPPTSRIYLIAGTPHVGGAFPPARTTGQQLTNPHNYWYVTHALFDAMDAWVKNGVEPPPSVYPRIADGTLMRSADLAVRRIGTATFPSAAYDPFRIDFGPGWADGAVTEPPRVTGHYPALVPQVDSDGNETSGIRQPFLVAPVATYTGWNLRDPKTGFPEARASFIGSWIPFPKEKILERYGSREAWFGRFSSAAMALIEQRLLLPEEMLPLMKRGIEEWELAVKDRGTD